MGCLKFLDSFRFLNAGLGELSTTETSIPTLDANGMGDE